MTEEPLTGGNSTEVVRVGETVRRTAGPWTPAVAQLLDLLAAARIEEVPEHRGFDREGREILSFTAGDVPPYPPPAWVWDDTILTEAGRLLRRIHDASVPLVDQPMTWQSASHPPHEVICHNDFAPYNLVFREGHLVGVIDFDTASPGPRIWDFAYLAYRLVPFAEDALGGSPGPDARDARLARLIRAYGGTFVPPEVWEVAAERLADLARFTDARAATTGRNDFLEHSAMYRRDRIRLLQLSESGGRR